MTKPIYKLGIARATQAWYQLSEDERNNLWGKFKEKKEELGVEDIVACDSRWSSESWGGFGVEKFPHIEAVQEYAKFLEENNWFLYVEAMTFLGTEWKL